MRSDAIYDEQQLWIQSLLSEPIGGDYLFYCTGHNGRIWSLVSVDSTGIKLYNGTTSQYTKCDEPTLIDTLSFINDNIQTIIWGIDSLVKFKHLLKPIENRTYNPIYNQLYLIKDNRIVFSYNDAIDYYSETDSSEFNHNLNKLTFLMLWLAAPSLRTFIPIPSDT